MGGSYFNGDGVPIDKEEAVKWYRLAADQHHSEAQYHLSRCHSKGEGIPMNKKVGSDLFFSSVMDIIKKT